MNITENEISSTKPAIIISPFKGEELNPEFNPSERVDVRGNLTVGATKDWGVLYGPKGVQGNARLAFYAGNAYIATSNPANGQAPAYLGTLHAKEIIVQRPMFATMEDAQAVLEPGREFVTPDGTIKQVI